MLDIQDTPEHAPAQCSAFEEVSVAAAATMRRAGEFAAAAHLARCALQLHPEDADAWFELGAAKSALDARGEARNAWLRTLDLAPSNDDARIGLAGLAWRDGDVAAAKRWLNSASPGRQQDGEALRLRSALDDADRPTAAWRLDAGVARSALSGGLPEWTETRVSLSRNVGATGLGAAVEHARRFNREDTFFELSATQKIGAAIWSLSLGATPEADYRPELSVRAGAEYYGAGWYVGGEIGHAEYVAGPVDKVGVRTGLDVAEGFRLQASAVAVKDENGKNRIGYGVGASWQATAQLAIEVGWSDAPESSDGMTVDVRSAVIGGIFEVSPDLRIRASIMRELRDAYDRTEASIGLARTF